MALATTHAHGLYNDVQLSGVATSTLAVLSAAATLGRLFGNCFARCQAR